MGVLVRFRTVFLVVTMSNFGRGGGWEILEGAGAGDGGWDGMAMVKLRKKRCSTLAFCVRRSSQQKWSGGWRVAVLTRSPGLQVYTQTNVHTNKSMAKISTYIHDMYVHIHDVSSHVYKYRCFLLFQTDGSRITADSRPTSIYLSLVCFTFGSGGVEE